ncbi:Oidioi.mRNA.OKI2018_I69.XSR.g16297.t1.cds [Oikopleura dioica]|uniref:Oidioi.mRNA.OKI2018_I69.XSR.g16297.t1.cds n=1 Tax=Oikopleura dioica TaxID=34765 RepID=A0ABN7SFL6_OIKDI|nr:Oidioi.mRNA.OKI2018_I69.XSR.g16297.t1.cds [Oikopleura dioica]
MRGVWLLSFPLLSSGQDNTATTDFCIYQETPEDTPESRNMKKTIEDYFGANYSAVCDWRNYVIETQNSSETNSSGSVSEKTDKFKSFEIDESPDKYRFNISSREEFKGYGYCYYSHVSCPLDKSDNKHLTHVKCQGSLCNQKSKIEAFFQMEESEAYEFLKEKGVRCQDHMEDTLSNRCYFCNQTHRAELVAGMDPLIEECKQFYEEYNITNPSEHTLTYVIIVLLLVICVAIYFSHMFFLRQKYPEQATEEENQMDDLESQPLVTDEAKAYIEGDYAPVNGDLFPGYLEIDPTSKTRNFRVSAEKLGDKLKFMHSLVEAQKIQKVAFFSSWMFSEDEKYFYMTAFKNLMPSTQLVSLQFIINAREARDPVQVVSMARALTSKLATGSLNSYFAKLQKLCRTNDVKSGVDTIFEISPKSVLFEVTPSGFINSNVLELILTPFKDDEPSLYGKSYDISSPHIYVNKHLIASCKDGEEHFGYQLKNIIGLIMQLMLGRNSEILYKRHPFVSLMNRLNPSRQSSGLGLSAGESSSDSSAPDVSEDQGGNHQLCTFSDILNRTCEFRQVEELGLAEYFCYIEEAQPLAEDTEKGLMGHAARVRPKYTHNFEELRNQVSWELADDLMDLDKRLWEHSLLWGPLNEWLKSLVINHLQPSES